LEDEMLWLHASFSSELLSQTSEIKMIFQEIVLHNYNREAGYKKICHLKYANIINEYLSVLTKVHAKAI